MKKNIDSSSKIHDLLKTNTAELHRETEELNALSLLTPSIKDYINHLTVMYKIVIPLENLILKFSEWEPFFPNSKPNQRSDLLLLDLQNLAVDLLKVEFTSFVPELSSFEQALGAYYVLEGSSLGGQFLYKKLSKIHGELLDNKMNYLYGFGKQTFNEWNNFIASLEKFTFQYPEKKPIIVHSAIETFRCFNTELKINNKVITS